MRNANVYIAFLFSLIFHMAILLLNLNVSRPNTRPMEIFRIRYTPRQKPAQKIVPTVPEIPVEKPKETPEKKPAEMPKELVAAEEPAVAAAHAKTMPEVKEITSEIDPMWIAVEELRNRIEAMKRYPRVARKQGIEGTVVMIIEFDKMGELIDIRIKSSAGHGILDRDALSLVKRASPLRHGVGRNIIIELPISYNLVEQ